MSSSESSGRQDEPAGESEAAAGPAQVLTRVQRRIMFALIVVGVVLRVIQYAADSSLWLDELSLARNVVHRSLGTLILQPLGYDQVAPLGFLAIEKLVILAIGGSDLALKFFPFLCGLGALPLMALVALRVLRGNAALIAVGLVAFGVVFVYYSSEVKQYSCDVVVALGLSLLALRLRDRQSSAQACLAAGALGALLPWFSQVAVFVMAGIGLVIGLGWVASRGKQWQKPALLTVPMWAAASIATVLVSLHHITADTTAYMHRYWQMRLGFPTPHQPGSDPRWLWDRLIELAHFEGYFTAWVYVVLCAVGVFIIWRRDRFIASVFAAPFVVSVAAALAQQYPFRARLALFLLPGLLIFVAAAVQWLAEQASKLNRVFSCVVLVLLLVQPVVPAVIFHPPFATEFYKQVLAAMQKERQPGDRVYVFPVAYEGVERYGPRYGLEEGEYTLGECRNFDVRAYLHDVDAFRGASRVWIVSSGFQEARESQLNYADAIGVRRGGLATRGTAAVLYDFSDATRLKAASADTFPVKPVRPDQPGICRAWTKPDPR